MSSIQLQAWQVDQFGRTVQYLSEQKTSRTLMCTSEEPFEGGELFGVDLFGGDNDAPSEVVDILTDTPIGDEQYARRWGVMRTYDHGTLLDKAQQVKLITNPNSLIAQRHANKMARGIDDVVIGAMNASVLVGKKSGSLVTTAFPAAQQIAVQASGVTVEKLIQAKELFNRNEVDESLPLYWYTNAKGISNLLREQKLTSADYAAIKALVNGEVDSFMGFTFIRTERLPTDASLNRLNFAVAAGAVRIAWGQRPMTAADRRPDKRNAWQLYTDMSLGAVRPEDKLVIEVACSEA